MTKSSTTTKTVQVPSADKLREVFQLTAEACGSDLQAVAEELGERPVVRREHLMDYVYLYGGTHGDEVSKWLHAESSMKKINTELNKAKVPKTWD